MKHISLTILLLLTCLGLTAQVQIDVKAPQQIIQGRMFRLEYVVNASEVQDIELGDFSGLDNLDGPRVSRQMSYSSINGQVTQSNTVTLTYTMRATDVGNHTIGAATLTIGGKKCKTKSVTIEVLPTDKQPSTSSGGNDRSASTSQSNGKEAFVTVSATKTSVYEQEALLVTFKVYALFQPTAIEDDKPDLNGCHIQEYGETQQKSIRLEHYNGRNYQTVVWRQFLVFPQQTGTLHIPSINYTIYGQQTVRSNDPMDIFFGGGSMVREFKKTVQSPALDIKVKPLPTPRPDNFSGAVGQFNLSTSLTPQELKVNDALTLRVVVSGTGNMKLIKAPKAPFPTDFETYDAKVEDKTRITAQGASGNKVFDYVAVPRHGGTFEIPAIQFCYFDPAKGEYRTLNGDAYSVQVEKGSGPASQSYTPTQKEDLAVLGEDIRFIKRGATHPVDTDSRLFGSVRYLGLYAAALALFALLAVIFRRQIAANADIARQRGRKAGKAATKRLKTARRMLREHRQNEFYDEVLKALWGYVADKLNIDIAALNRDNVSEQLQAKGYTPEIIDRLLAVISDCEFARYAPGDPSENMDKTYQAAEKIINEIK